MRKLKISLIFLLLLSFGCANMRKRDYALQGAYLAVTALDWIQTNKITAKCEEANPLIGECGKDFPPVIYFPFSMYLYLILINKIPEDQRDWIEGLSLGIEAKTVHNNYLKGITF